MTTLFGPLAWPDTVAITIGYLAASTELAGIHIGSQVPNPATAPFVLVDRAGGVRDGIFDQARLACSAWAATAGKAADIVNDLRDLLQQMPAFSPLQGFTVCQVTEYLGPTFTPDQETDTPRYLLTVEARFRANPKGT